MVNGFRYYRALESVSMIASALSTALTICPCQIRVHQRWQSKLQLPTARKKEWRPATAGSSPACSYLSTLWYCGFYFSRPRTHNLKSFKITLRQLVAEWYGAGLTIARSWVRIPPAAAVYQRQLSVPSLRGRLISTSESWGVNGHTTRCTGPAYPWSCGFRWCPAEG